MVREEFRLVWVLGIIVIISLSMCDVRRVIRGVISDWNS